MLLQTQADLIERCVDSLMDMAGVVEGASDEDMESGTWYSKEAYSVEKESLEGFLLGTRSFVSGLYDDLDDEDQNSLLGDVSSLFLTTVVEFLEMKAERDVLNDPVEDGESQIPPVLAEDVANMSTREFTTLLNRTHREAIDSFYGDEKEALFDLFKDFKQYVQDSNPFPSDGKVRGFNESWSVVPAQFLKLRIFFGGFASIFPNIATVESDFSIMGYEKNDHRQNLAHISLSGIMHAKQRNEIKNVPLRRSDNAGVAQPAQGDA